MGEPQEYTNRELYILIDKGFKGVHEKQDKTNGKLIKHDTRITSIENWKSKLIGAFVITNIIFLPIVFAFLIKYIK